ncbi:MAG TPA: monovalent cation/H+ antiporter complex subunit F [Candidatus Elarobacter sp.]|nr:monovalent cation/H+ antiporter complex subunit F [Candidatus Elarobacter sp.]
MSVWLLASAALMLGILPCVVLAARGNAIDRLVALELASVFTVLALLTFEQGEQRQSFFDLSLALAVVSFPSSLIFARVLRRWL